MGDSKQNLEGAYRAAINFAESLDGWMVLMGPPGPRGKHTSLRPSLTTIGSGAKRAYSS